MDEDEQFQQAFGERTIPQHVRDEINDIRNNNPDNTGFSLRYQYVSQFSDLALELIGRYIASNTHLKEINLSNFSLNDSTISNIFRRLSQGHQVLEELHLIENQIGPNGIRSMVPFLKNSQQLSNLDLSCNRNIKTEGFEVLINALDGGLIEELNLWKCKIEDISVLGNCTLSHLRDLELQNNNIRSMGSISTLQNYTNLERLDLEGNNVGIDGCRTIAKLLQNEDSRLETLDLASNKIDDDGAEILATSLKHNNTLTRLYLWKNKITERGFCAFLRLLNDVSSIDRTYNSNHALTDLVLTDSMEISGLSNEIERYILTATNANQYVYTGREKVISTQLDSTKRQRLCHLQGFDSPYNNIFAEIDPVVLPDILALIGGRSCGQSDLYRALVATAPELTSLINRKALLQKAISKNAADIAALDVEYFRLTAKRDELCKRMALMESSRGDQSMIVSKRSVGNKCGNKRQRSASF